MMYTSELFLLQIGGEGVNRRGSRTISPFFGIGAVL
jgi:hypothetical protein